MPIKAVIFDLDGTITQPHFDFDAIREEIGLPANSGPLLETMAKMSHTQRQRAEKILHSHEKQAVIQSKLNPGVKQTLAKFADSGIYIGILTRNTTDNALAVLEMHGLKVDAVVGREHGPVKPDAFGVLQICRQFGIKPQETLLVGDYLFDLLCAKAAGAVAILLKNHDRAAEFAEYADFTIDKLQQIIQIIEDINSQK